MVSELFGALDGSHIPATVPSNVRSAFRNRKGDLSQNILGMINFNMILLSHMLGMKDQHMTVVLSSAMTQGFTVLEEKYYLGDAGYGLSKICLTPYRGVRYHLKELERGDRRLQNKEELCNLRHSSLRNVIERTLIWSFEKAF